MEEPQEPRTITVQATLTIEADNEKTATEKAEYLEQYIKDHYVSYRNTFDTGVTAVGTITLDGETAEDL